MTLEQWAIKWGIPLAALADLRREFGLEGQQLPKTVSGASEAAVQSRVRLEASRKGLRLWRNNVGACQDLNGNFIRYGLANESAAQNRKIKSSDLIGIRAVSITPAHVGSILGQFVAREIKPENWRYTATEREQAQLKYLELITSFGGDAAFATGEGTL